MIFSLLILLALWKGVNPIILLVLTMLYLIGSIHDIDLTEAQRNALDLVSTHHLGDEITGKDIANAIHLRQRDSGKEGADLRAVVNALRKKGYPVCANGSGYYYPRTRREIEEYMDSLRGRIRKEQEALSGMADALPVWDQMPEVREPTSREVLEI